MNPHYQSLEFHNVAGLETYAGLPGVLLPRYPATVRSTMNEGGAGGGEDATGVEIRFVTDAWMFRISFTGLEAGTVDVYCGDFFHSRHPVQAGVVTTLNPTRPERFDQVRPEVLVTDGFAPGVWRIIFDRMPVVFHGIDTFGRSLRPPEKEETPRFKWLAYGSSITHSSAKNGYIHLAARRLRADVLNKGLSGACLCEPEVADFLARECDWDFATLETGVNMMGRFEPEEFEKRVRYLLETMAGTEKPVIVLGIFPNNSPHSIEDNPWTRHYFAYRKILNQLAAELPFQNLQFLDGAEILTDFAGLGADLIHPTEYGHALMGENLASILRQRIGLK